MISALRRLTEFCTMLRVWLTLDLYFKMFARTACGIVPRRNQHLIYLIFACNTCGIRSRASRSPAARGVACITVFMSDADEIRRGDQKLVLAPDKLLRASKKVAARSALTMKAVGSAGSTFSWMGQAEERGETRSKCCRTRQVFTHSRSQVLSSQLEKG